jgi:hypothetical protein
VVAYGESGYSRLQERLCTAGMNGVPQRLLKPRSFQSGYARPKGRTPQIQELFRSL